MPFEQMNQQQVADYLKMDRREVNRLSCRGSIPCRKVGGRFVYHKADIDHWVETQMPQLDKRRLADIEAGVREHHGMEHEAALILSLIPPDGVAVPLAARTRDSVLRGLVDLADDNEMVLAKDELLEAIRAREEMCSTAFGPGVAMPHPRHPLPYDITASFVIVGLTHSGIPFGAEDGSLTRLFFLICCKDERTHVHVLARLCRMLLIPGAMDNLLACETPDDLREHLAVLEREAVKI